MSLRRLLRIVLSIVVIALVWWRVPREWHERSGLWVAGAALLSVVLLLVVIMEATGMQQKWKKQKDEVPKKPLGLDV